LRIAKAMGLPFIHKKTALFAEGGGFWAEFARRMTVS
jgi:hypothetical protein